MNRTSPVSFPLSVICLLYLAPIGCLILVPPILLIFVPPFHPWLFGQFIAFFGIIFYSIFGILKLLENGLNRYYQANQVRDVKQDKINFLIGFGGIIVCTIIPRVAVYFVDGGTFIFISFMAILSILFLTAIFLTYSRKTVSALNYNDHPYTSIWNLGFHVILLLVSLRPALSMHSINGKAIITQIIFGINCLSSTLDFIVVWTEGFHLQAPRAPVEAPEVDLTETSRYSFTDFSAVTLCCLSLVTFIYGSSIHGGETILMTILGCALVFGGVWGLAVVLKRVSAKGKMMVGLGAMGIIGFVPRTVHGTLIDAIMPNLILSTTLTLSFALSIYYHFIYTNRPPVLHFQYEAHESIIEKFALIHSLIFIAMIRISYGYWRSTELEVIVISQLAFFLLPLASSIDFWMIWNDAVVFKDGEKEVMAVKKPKVVEKKQKVVKLKPPRVTCFSCHQSYNEGNKIPRILKECGHTICEECAKKRLAENHEKHLFCPTCRRVTVVRSAANTLMKNYLVLEMMEEVKKM